MEEFKKPMTLEDFKILLRNFKLNLGDEKNRMLPEVLKDGGQHAILQQKKNLYLKENKQPEEMKSNHNMNFEQNFNKKLIPEK